MRGVPLDLPSAPQVLRLGVEHELSLSRDGEPVDFRREIERVAGHIAQLDPGDPRARRLPSGAALTADGWEAELVTPPLPLGAGAAGEADRLLRAERTELRRVSGLDVAGFSTHLNVSVPDDRVVALAEELVRSASVAIALVVDPRDSAGLLVRPRRGRLEVGGEYVEGADLVDGLVLLAAVVVALLAGAEPPDGPRPDVTASREKFGWFVPPSELEDRTALARTWAWARPYALANGLSPHRLDRLAAGRRELRRDRGGNPAACRFDETVSTPVVADTTPRERPWGARLQTEWVTWSHVVWRVEDRRGRVCRAVVPAHLEAEFLHRLDEGQLDAALRHFVEHRHPHRLLAVSAQLRGAALWHDVRPGALVPAERRMDGSVPRVHARAARRAHRRSLRLAST